MAPPDIFAELLAKVLFNKVKVLFKVGKKYMHPPIVAFPLRNKLFCIIKFVSPWININEPKSLDALLKLQCCIINVEFTFDKEF